MKTNPLFGSPNFTIDDYLNVHNISDTKEFFKSTGKYVDNQVN